MNVRLALAATWLPGFVKRKKLRDLLHGCAAAFGVPAPDVAGKRRRELLAALAALTARQAQTPRDDAATAMVRGQLRATAFEMGLELRRTLGVRTRAQAMRAARLVYRILGIDFHGRADGTIVIRSCAFSRLYSPADCALVSGLDEGLLAGLAGPGRLEFSSRITEGCDRCRAAFRFQDDRP